MDGTATMTEAPQTFRSPRHILLPNLLRSRDNWKAKAQHRRYQVKRAQLTIRDLTRSRDRWRHRFDEQQRHIQRLTAEIEQLRHERDLAVATATASAPKK